ncbi:MAG TPA: hypothetical protein VLJ78_08910, partial [Microvirga sp.]|nr:hypothetical protein [Microvirga sp.]
PPRHRIQLFQEFRIAGGGRRHDGAVERPVGAHRARLVLGREVAGDTGDEAGNLGGVLLRQRIADAALAEDIPFSSGGALVCIEGPQFSTYAESITYRQLGYDVIGMTAMPEAKLAREAEITYATIAMVTDYDCWHPEHDHVDVASVVAVAHQNATKVARLVARVARDFPAEHEPCPVGSDRALDGAIMTAPSARDPELLKKLDAVAGRVLNPSRA